MKVSQIRIEKGRFHLNCAVHIVLKKKSEIVNSSLIVLDLVLHKQLLAAAKQPHAVNVCAHQTGWL